MIAPDGRIHTSFQNTVTATGRLSSTEPNLQNIPVRTELGAELRKMFVAPAGKVLVDADYSQIELRLLAHIAGDQAMIDGFRSGEDIHTITAAQVFGVARSEVTPLMRRSAKAVNFGIVYGISPFSLSQDIGVTVAEAKEYMDKYFAHYAGVRAYMDAVVEQAREQGFVSTLYGRRRWVPELKSSNFNTRSFGERVALNAPIQGTAADIIKLAMIRVRDRLKAEGLEDRGVSGIGGGGGQQAGGGGDGGRCRPVCPSAGGDPCGPLLGGVPLSLSSEQSRGSGVIRSPCVVKILR